MPNYRCPICGANHKKYQENCRLCGQNMSGEFIPTGPAPAPTTSVTSQIGKNGGNKSLWLIGVVVVVSIGLAGIFFGFIKSNPVIEKGKNAFVAPVDGWTEQAEPPGDGTSSAGTASAVGGGSFVVMLPGDRLREEVAFPATTSGKITAWTAKVGTDTKIQVGSGKIVPPPPGAGLKADGTPGTAVDQTPTTQNFLNDIAVKWAVQNGLTAATYSGKATFIGGNPAYVINSTGPKFKLGDREAFGWLGLSLKGDTLYVVQVYSIFGDAPQFERVASTLQVS